MLIGTGPVPVVIWDLGNVLIPWDRLGALARCIEDPAEARRLAEEVFTMEVNVHLDAGRPLAEVRAEVERDHPELGWVVDAYVENFRHSLGPPIEGSAALLGELVDAGVRNVGLSNWGVTTFAGVADDYEVIGLLEGVVISGEIGVCKPHPAIYRYCESRFDFEPAEALFIDDSPANVAAARDCGWEAVVFTGAEDLRVELARRGLVAA